MVQVGYQLPDDLSEWGVLGYTRCPLCRSLRRDPVFCVLWIGALLGGLWVLSALS